MRVNPAYSINAVDRLIHDFFQENSNLDRYAKNEIGFNPAVNVFELNDAVRIELQIPGFSKDQVTIILGKDILSVKGEVSESGEDGISFSRVEFRTSGFEKKFKLNADLDADKIQANFTNGILILTITKKEEKKPIVKKIEIA